MMSAKLSILSNMKALLVLLTTVDILCFSNKGLAQTQSDLNAEARNDFTKASKQLDIAYKKLLDTLDGLGREKLIKAENAWLAYREAQAALEADQVRGGTAAPSILDATRAELTRERIDTLSKMLDKE
jgi:uncharacterized protein YecT (DUF1311 family)